MNLKFKNICRLHLITLLAISISIFSPSMANAEEWIYTTRPGDTIWDISKKYLKSVNDWSKVQKHNNVNIAKHLAPGTRIRIPLKWLKISASPATVINVTGTVNYKTSVSDNLISLTSKQTVNIGDAVKTGKNGSALIQFADGSTLLMQKNSQVIFNTLSSYGETGMVDTRFRLQQGRIETSVKPMRDSGSRYEITTPAAVAAVRGTKFRVAYQDDRQTMASEVVKGSINVAAEGVNQPVNPGFGTITEKGKPPQPPVQLLQKPELETLPVNIRYLPFTFNWPSLDGAKKYRVQITPASEPGNLRYQDIHESAEFTLNSLIDGQYILRIRAMDKNSLEGFNADHKFTIDTNFPIPSLTAPIMNSELSQPPYLFEWTKASAANQYMIQVSTDINFDNIIIERLENSNTLSLNDKLSVGQYFWRVAAVDQKKNKGHYSSIEKFTITDNNYKFLLILLYLLPAFLL